MNDSGMRRSPIKKRISTPLFLKKLLIAVCQLLRHFSIEIRGEDNLPQNTPVIFVCNHSNSHDVLLAMEVFSHLPLPFTFLAASDGLGVIPRTVFLIENAVLIRRFSKESRQTGFDEFYRRILKNANGFIFPESTWNLHPTLPMHKLNAGFIRASLLTKAPVIPVIFEYIEVQKQCKKERELYSRCVVTFGKPIYLSMEQDIFDQAEHVRLVMSEMRRVLWKEFDIKRESLDMVDRELYLNHLDMKKNHAFGCKYAQGTIRITLGLDNTSEQMDRIAHQISTILR